MSSQIASAEYAARVNQDKLEIARRLPDDIIYNRFDELRSLELDQQVYRLFTETVVRVIEVGVDIHQARAEALYAVEAP